MAKRHIQHVKSSVVEQDGRAKAPTVDDLFDGEIAVNFGAGSETLFIRNSSREIVAFGKEVNIGEETPLSGTNYQLFIDESVDPLEVEVYTKSDIDSKEEALQLEDSRLNSEITTLSSDIENKVIAGNDVSTAITASLFVDETNQSSSEVVYTQTQVDNLIANLQSQIDELKSRIN